MRHEPRATPHVVNPQVRKALKGRNKRPASPVSPFQGWYVQILRTRGDVRGYTRFTLPRAGMFRPVGAKNRPCARSFRMNQRLRPHRPGERTEIRWSGFEELGVEYQL